MSTRLRVDQMDRIIQRGESISWEEHSLFYKDLVTAWEDLVSELEYQGQGEYYIEW